MATVICTTKYQIKVPPRLSCSVVRVTFPPGLKDENYTLVLQIAPLLSACLGPPAFSFQTAACARAFLFPHHRLQLCRPFLTAELDCISTISIIIAVPVVRLFPEKKMYRAGSGESFITLLCGTPTLQVQCWAVVNRLIPLLSSPRSGTSSSPLPS